MAKHSRTGEGVARPLMIALALGWLVVALALPFASVFVAAFADGLPAFVAALTTPEVLHAAWLTILAMLAALAFNSVFGIAAAYAVERTRLPGRRVIALLLDLPIAVSPVVAGLMFLLLFGRQGWFGPLLDSLGVRIVFALPGILLATIFVTLPFVAKEVIAVLRETGPAEEEAAVTLGANRVQTFFHVVLPNIRWAVFYGLVLTAARALGEFGAVSLLRQPHRPDTDAPALHRADLHELPDHGRLRRRGAAHPARRSDDRRTEAARVVRVARARPSRRRGELMTRTAHDSQAGIEVSGVSRAFGGFQALRDVDLEVRPGELIALLGPSGSARRRCCASSPGSRATTPEV